MLSFRVFCKSKIKATNPNIYLIKLKQKRKTNIIFASSQFVAFKINIIFGSTKLPLNQPYRVDKPLTKHSTYKNPNFNRNVHYKCLKKKGPFQSLYLSISISLKVSKSKIRFLVLSFSRISEKRLSTDHCVNKCSACLISLSIHQVLERINNTKNNKEFVRETLEYFYTVQMEQSSFFMYQYFHFIHTYVRTKQMRKCKSCTIFRLY